MLGRGSAFLRGALLAAAWCLWGATASATHERATLISWAPAGGNTVEFEVQGSWRRSAYTTGNGGCRNPASPTLASIPCTGPGGQAGIGDVIVESLGGTQFNPGDGSGNIGSPLGPLLYLVTAIDAPNDWLFGEALDPNVLPGVDTTIEHTYPATGNFTAFLDDCCRLSITATNAHINNPDGSYRIESIVNVGSGNSPPASAMPPIVLCPINGVCAFTVPASDPDLDTLHFRLSTSAEASGTPPGFVQPGPPNAPNAASINSTSGVYTWNTTGATLGAGAANTIYSTQVTIEDRDGGNNVKSKIAVDFLIQLVAQAGVPPVFDQPPTPTCGSTVNALVGSNLSFTVQASDADFGQTVTLNGVGIPLGATMTPPLPTSGDPVSSVFNWTPTGGQVGLHVITFSATDTAMLQTLCSVTINAAAPPTPTASTTATSTSTATASASSTATATGTATSTATETHTLAIPNTATATATVTATATATGTSTTTLTPSITPTPSATRTPIVVDNTLVVNKIKLRFDNSSARDNGKAVIRALVDDNDTSGGLETSLLAGTVIVRVLDSDQFDATFTISGCSVKGPSGIVACKSADRRVKAIFKPTAQGPFVYNMLAVAKRIPATITGAQQPEGPLAYVLMDQGGHPRSDDIGSINPCQPAGTKGLKCREK